MNIEYLQKAISILNDLGEKNLADEVRNITLFFLHTEDDPMDSDYDSDDSMESDTTFDKYEILDNNREI
jgi:hypothetical protein